MKYKELLPTIVERDREDIKSTIASVLPTRQDIINARIDALLEDAFMRGISYGKECVLNDPGSYDLFSSEGREE